MRGVPNKYKDMTKYELLKTVCAHNGMIVRQAAILSRRDEMIRHNTKQLVYIRDKLNYIIEHPYSKLLKSTEVR